MTASERIRQKREELVLTQDELAKKLGYKSRSSVNKVETSRDLSLKRVTAYAVALGVTPAYLMGWEDDKGNDICSNDIEMPTYSHEHLELIELYSKLNDTQKESILTLMRSMV